MIEIIDALTGKRKKINSDKLVFLERKSNDYILSIPHGGIFIPAEFKDKLNIGRALLTGTDLFTEQVYNTKAGIAIISRLNPYLVNMSRFREGNQDESLPSHLQMDPLHGLSLTDEKILKEEYSPEEREMILNFYDRYHSLIEKAIQEMKLNHDFALMFDCHSMNPRGLKNTPDEGKERADFVIGTLNDKSAHQEIISVFYETLRTLAGKLGFTVKKNCPYKGGFITQRYGKPSENIHVIQLEVKNSNYMDRGPFRLDLKGLQRINSIISKVFKVTSAQAKRMYK